MDPGVVAHRLVTGDPKRKWMVVQGAPSVGVIRQAQDYGWEVECFYSHTFKPVTPEWASKNSGSGRWSQDHATELNEAIHTAMSAHAPSLGKKKRDAISEFTKRLLIAGLFA